LGDGAAGGGDPNPAQTYRDPIQVDAGCTAPNVLCGGGSTEGGADDDGGGAEAGSGIAVCVPVLSDVANCGACGNVCIGPGATCLAGTCGCMGPLTAYCGDTGCMDVSSDNANCGGCGVTCAAMTQCSQGACVPQ
jgi:hypothetical protein